MHYNIVMMAHPQPVTVFAGVRDIIFTYIGELSPSPVSLIFQHRLSSSKCGWNKLFCYRPRTSSCCQPSCDGQRLGGRGGRAAGKVGLESRNVLFLIFYFSRLHLNSSHLSHTLALTTKRIKSKSVQP